MHFKGLYRYDKGEHALSYEQESCVRYLYKPFYNIAKNAHCFNFTDCQSGVEKRYLIDKL